MSTEHAFQICINPQCRAKFEVREVLAKCPKCGNLLDVDYEWDKLALPKSLKEFSDLKMPACGLGRVSGVWRFGALMPFADEKYHATIGEGHTQLRQAKHASAYVGGKFENVWLQYEGLNPSGSFKDNGMAGAFTHAQMVGAKVAACASTGNTSASLAAFAANLGIKAVVFVGSGKIAFGKLSQALDYGAQTLQIAGDFDDAMARVQEVCVKRDIYLVNSVNPFRLEGQKAIMLRVLEGFGWEVPDWILVPGGNLGNSSAFGKAFIELKKLGLIDRMPRIAIINSLGAPTLNNLVNDRGLKWNDGNVDDAVINKYYSELDEKSEKAHTLASAIEINRPVNLKKCLRAIEATNGLVRTVTDQEILDAKAQVGRDGIGCEPASAASVAGLKKLIAEGVINPEERVACVLTGHQLKDPNATVAYHSYAPEQLAEKYGTFGVSTSEFSNMPIPVDNSLDDILGAIG